MNPDVYLHRTIAKHLIKPEQRNRAILISKRLYPIIKRWAYDNLITITQSGSFAKGTNITGSSDIDLFISLKHTTPLTLKENYDILADFINFNNFNIEKQNVSIKVKHKEISIDLVPGRKQPGPTRDHSLYFRKSDTWIKTNIYKHIAFIKTSKCRLGIRAIKIWKKLHGLEFPSFYLELSVINALKGYKKVRLSNRLERTFEYLSFEFENARIVDPANSNNIVSDELSSSEKEKIKKTAHSSLNTNNWSAVIW